MASRRFGGIAGVGDLKITNFDKDQISLFYFKLL